MNLYKVIDELGLSINYWGVSMTAVRKDFECARPGDKISRIIQIL